VIRLDAATVALQWSVGGMAMCWFTTRRRVVGVGYGWLLRGVYAVLAVLGVAAGVRAGALGLREVSAGAAAVGCLAVLAVSIVRRHAGVALAEAEHDRRTARVAAMTGIERESRDVAARGDEFPPVLDLVPVALGLIGLVAGAISAVDGSAGDVIVSLLRVTVGALFLGAVTDAMLLGHWYLVQPGLPRSLLNEIVGAVGLLWPIELAVMLLPTGMWSVLTGSVDDGWGGQLGWFWLACTITTIALVVVTRAALKERQYSAVMAATGLLYLAILTAFGMDLVARAVLAG
jgi:heme exporter protein D